MTTPTQMSLQGFIATVPEISFSDTGHSRFYCRVGIEQHRKEADGSFTKLDPVYCDLVLFDRAAERAYPRFKPGDQIVASGYIHEYEQQRADGTSGIREQFVARRIGHDCVRTRYVVDRGPGKQPDPPSTETVAGKKPAEAVGI